MNNNIILVPKDICMSSVVITNRKYVCDNCNNAYLTSQEDGELPSECPFCNATTSCGSLDISFDA